MKSFIPSDDGYLLRLFGIASGIEYETLLEQLKSIDLINITAIAMSFFSDGE